MYYYGGNGCNTPSFPTYPVYYGNNNNSSYAIVLVLFILLVIVIGSRQSR